MNKEEVIRLRERLEADFKKKEEDFKKKLDALALVEQMLAEDGVQAEAHVNGAKPQERGPETADPPRTATPEPEYGSLIDCVEAKFRSNPDVKWTVAKLIESMTADGFKFQAQNPSGSLNTTLPKLVERGMVRIVKRGRGSGPSIYQLVKVNPEHQKEQTVE